MADAAGHSFLVALIGDPHAGSASRRCPIPRTPAWRASLPGTAADAMHADLETRLGAAAERARDLLRPLAFAAGSGLPWESMWAAARVQAQRARLHRRGPDLAAAAGRLRTWWRPWSRTVPSTGSTMPRLPSTCGRAATRRPCTTRSRRSSSTGSRARSRPGLGPRPPVHARPPGHARAGGWTGLLDDLLLDPGYLVNAVPAGLLAALPAARDPAAARAGVAYQRAVHQFRNQPEQQRASYLQFAARIARAPELAAQVDARFPNRRWSIPWTHWPPEYPHRVLGGRLGAVTGILVTGGHRGGTARPW